MPTTTGTLQLLTDGLNSSTIHGPQTNQLTDKLYTSLSSNTIMDKLTNHFYRLTNTVRLTLKVTSLRLLKRQILTTVVNKFQNKWIIKFLRILREGHKRFLEFKNSKLPKLTF